MLNVLSDSFMLATRMDAFSYQPQPRLEGLRVPARRRPLAGLRRVLAGLF